MSNCPHTTDKRTLSEVGERFIKERIICRLQQSPCAINSLIGGLGHDAGVLNNPLSPNDQLLINTDRSGINIAYKLGLAGGECIGSFAVSHAISDIIATGGTPFAISVALLLPDSTTIVLVDEIMDGISQSCIEYGVTLTGGDTKRAESLSLVVTALGKAPISNILFRNTPREGDKLVVSGYLGSMLIGSIIHKRKHKVSKPILDTANEALIHQGPPFRLGLMMSNSHLANACTDISDGLQAACKNMLEGTCLGAEIDESLIPIHPIFTDFAESLSITPIQLSMAGGDWQFLYSISKENVSELDKISRITNTPLTVIGEITDRGQIIAKTLNSDLKKLRSIENDSFGRNNKGKSYFEFLSDPQEMFE